MTLVLWVIAVLLAFIAYQLATHLPKLRDLNAQHYARTQQLLEQVAAVASEMQESLQDQIDERKHEEADAEREEREQRWASYWEK